MFKLILIILGVLVAVISENQLLIGSLIIGSLLFILITNRDKPNVFHLCFGFITLKILEMIIFENFIIYESNTLSSMWINAIIFSIHFITDLFFFLFVLFRAPLSRIVLLAINKPIDNIYMYQAEFAFMSLYVVLMLVDLAALLENFIRHLDQLGFSDEIAEHFTNWTWIFYHYIEIKSSLVGIFFILLWSMTSKFGQKKHTTTSA
ncbi:MAG: hypothetical protein ACI9LM_005527 [Alteromonadaceae bacterium]|jgi:hypothetical protein